MENLDSLISRYQEQYKEDDRVDYLEQHKALLTYNSATLEGSTLSLLDVQLLVEKDYAPQGRPLEHILMVKDHYNALTYALEMAGKKEAITEKVIKRINGLLREHTGKYRETPQGAFDERAGDYRLIAVHANVTQVNNIAKSIPYPLWTLVPSLMQDLIFSLEEGMNTVKSAEEVYNFSFDAHYHLRAIHPFSDGNSRTSRLLMNYIQHYHQLPITPVNSLHRSEYISAFYASNRSNPAPMRTFLMQEARQFLKDMVVHKVESEQLLTLKHKNKSKGKGQRF